MSAIRRIGIFLDLIGAHGRGMFVGIWRYADEVGHWHLQIPPFTPAGLVGDISNWEVDGWIAFGRDDPLGKTLARRPVPTVFVSTGEAFGGAPAVIPDHEAVGRMAFDHLLDRGHTHFAYVGFNVAFSRYRHGGFAQAAEAFGRVCHVFPDYSYDVPSDDRLTAWLLQLPKPIGIFAAEDHTGAIIIDCCRRAGIAVPQAVAVVGVDNDELRCTVRKPTLSSIQLDSARIGYEAAALLDQLLNREPAPRKWLQVPPIRVVTRQSTDELAFADEDVRNAVQFIRDRIAQPTSVAQVLAHTATSHQSLDARFRKQLGSPILRYIHKLHVEHAISLLTSTELPISQVARQSGFRSPTRMAIVFRKIADKTPRDFRRPQPGPRVDAPVIERNERDATN